MPFCSRATQLLRIRPTRLFNYSHLAEWAEGARRTVASQESTVVPYLAPIREGDANGTEKWVHGLTASLARLQRCRQTAKQASPQTGDAGGGAMSESIPLVRLDGSTPRRPIAISPTNESAHFQSTVTA